MDTAKISRFPHWICLVIALCGFLFFLGLADRDLWSSHEGRAAQDAQTILDQGNWGLPRLLDGKKEMQKPPLYYWLVAMGAWLRGGVDAWAVRLPAAVAALSGVLWLIRLGGSRRGILAAIMLATMLHYTWLARTGRIDMVLAFTISLTLGGFYLARETSAAWQRCSWLCIAYLAVGLSLLLKGPIGFVLPIAVIGVFLLCEQELPSPTCWRGWGRLLHRLGLWWGVPLALGVALPWYVWVGQATGGEFYRVFFWHHNLERGLGGSETLAAHPWWYYAPRVMLDMLPWSLLLPAAVWLIVRRGWWRQEPLARFGLIWFLTMMTVLSLAQFKRADYLLPAYPGAALFLAVALERWYRDSESPRRWALTLEGIVLAYCLAWWVYCGYILPRQEPYREQQSFAALIREHVPAPRPVIFFRVEDHALAFHVGGQIDTILEWENIDVWASRPGTFYMVMTPDCASEWASHVTSGQLEEVARNTDLSDGRHKNPLVLLRTRPKSH
jgi:4-amino-4-deoxy-L-arabinose transferase-like glycosyltransferase